ncbi:MAG: phage recombination protein Bet [Eggerthellaceae bacterium]|jgi:phage recombination protein Bet|nr:phage recombination protein Bet [Eggerthellaceae bacterium]MCH4220468.1 phage recombination protein Bet [Eggerthellaceae bacterium]
MSETGIVTYKAADGMQVKLSPSIVAKFIVSGNSDADDKDIFAFMAKCQARGLNPLAGDAYMTVFQGANGNKTASVIVSKDYFIRTATSQSDFDGYEAGVVVLSRSGEMEYRTGALVGTSTEKLIGGWAKVYSKNRSHPSEAVVSLNEYSTGRSMWRDTSRGGKPATMIRKVALVQAIREAYPGQFGGVYDRAEMPEHEAAPSVEVVSEPTEGTQAEPTQELPSPEPEQYQTEESETF